MKTKKITLLLTFIISTTFIFAQEMEVNTSKSTIKWLGKKIGGQHTGYIQLKNGAFDIKDNKIVAGNFAVDMTSITNTDLEDEGYNKKLVGHLKSDDFFGVDNFPEATFKVIKSTTFKNGQASVTGKITIKDKTESITFDVKRSGKTFEANIAIDRSEFDVRYGSNSFFNNLGDKAIDDIFTLEIKLIAN